MAKTKLKRLKKWKREAMFVLAEWELVWKEAGCPGQLGESKAKAVLNFIKSKSC